MYLEARIEFIRILTVSVMPWPLPSLQRMHLNVIVLHL